MSYRITFKGNKEPVYMDNASGKMLQADFVAGNIPDRLIIRGNAYLGIDIRAIEHTDEVQREDGEKRHWIIINEARGQIWKQVYKTYEEAKAELDFQLAGRPNMFGWVVEERGGTEKRPDVSNFEMDEIDKAKAELSAKWGKKKTP